MEKCFSKLLYKFVIKMRYGGGSLVKTSHLLDILEQSGIYLRKCVQANSETNSGRNHLNEI